MATTARITALTGRTYEGDDDYYGNARIEARLADKMEEWTGGLFTWGKNGKLISLAARRGLQATAPDTEGMDDGL